MLHIFAIVYEAILLSGFMAENQRAELTTTALFL